MARKQPPREEGAPIWMGTYADLMSLLLCFFVMLFAMSIIAEVKWEALVETLQRDFGYQGRSNNPQKGKGVTPSVSSITERSRRTSALTGGQPIQSPQGPATSIMTIRTEGELVRGGVILFELGHDALTERAKEGLSLLFTTLYGSPYKIQLRGHAGPTEVGRIHTEDTDLAYNRAFNVREHLVELGLKKEDFEIVADPSYLPNPAILPPGVDPNQAASSVTIMLLDKTLRVLRDNRDQRTTDAPTQ